MTFPGPNNTRSIKNPLPTKCIDAIKVVGRHTLKGKEMTLAELLYKIQQRFSSIKYPGLVSVSMQLVARCDNNNIYCRSF